MTQQTEFSFLNYFLRQSSIKSAKMDMTSHRDYDVIKLASGLTVTLRDFTVDVSISYTV